MRQPRTAEEIIYAAPPPMILADTSALLDYGRAELESTATRAKPSTSAVLDALMGKGARTIITTRRNFMELFQSTNGRVDLIEDGKGGLVIPPGLGAEHFKIPLSYHLYTLLSDSAARGNIRTYRSIDAMLEHIDGDAGKLVIVDTMREPDADVVNAPGYTPEKYRQWYLDSHRADDCLVQLTHRLVEHLDKTGSKDEGTSHYSLALLNNDLGLRNRVEQAALSHKKGITPCFMQSQTALQALEKNGALSTAMTGHFLNTLRDLRAKDGFKLTTGGDRYHEELRAATDWLDTTAQIQAALAGLKEQPDASTHTARAAARKGRATRASR